MRPAESFIAQPVRSLQTMLRVLAEDDQALLSVIPDGIYGSNTEAAVSTFQRKSGLPVTGIADQQTWDRIVPEYELALIRVGQAQPLELILEPNQVIRRGERNPNVYVLQGVLTVLSDGYGAIPAPGFSGVIDLPTSESLAAFQRLSLLPETGELDKVTWKHLALQYPAAANQNQ